MQFPITIGLRRSRFLRIAVVATHAAAGVMLAIPESLRHLLGPTLLVLAVSAALAWRATALPVQCLRIFADGHIDAEFAPESGGTWRTGAIGVPSRIHPWFTRVTLELQERKINLVLLPDSLDAEDFRRLRVWLRWRRQATAA